MLPFFTADSIFPLRFLFPSHSTFLCCFLFYFLFKLMHFAGKFWISCSFWILPRVPCIFWKTVCEKWKCSMFFSFILLIEFSFKKMKLEQNLFKPITFLCSAGLFVKIYAWSFGLGIRVVVAMEILHMGAIFMCRFKYIFIKSNPKAIINSFTENQFPCEIIYSIKLSSVPSINQQHIIPTWTMFSVCHCHFTIDRHILSIH